MNSIASSFVLLLLVAVEDPPAPKWPVGKDTTYFTSPLDKDGYVDFEAALNDRLGKGITPESNANVLLWKAMGPVPQGGTEMPPEYFKQLGMEPPPPRGDYFVGLNAFGSTHLKLDKDKSDALNGQLMLAARRPWTATDYPQLASWLEANEKPLAVVVEASKRLGYFNPLICRRNQTEREPLLSALVPNLPTCRELAYALAARAMRRTGEGKVDEAWQDLISCHRLGRLVARGAVLIDGLVGIAIDAIAMEADLAYLERAGLAATQCLEKMKELQSLAPMPPAADKVDLGERVGFLDAARFVHLGRVRALESLRGVPLTKLDVAPAVLAKIDWGPALRAGNHWYDRIAAAMRVQDRAQRLKAFRILEKELEDRKQSTPDLAELTGKDLEEAIATTLIDLFMPAFRQVQDAYDRNKQMHQNLYLAFALAAFHADTGRYPEKLTELAPKYVTAVPNDIFSGKALIYRAEEGGYLLYSVGINGKDEYGGPPDHYVAGGNISVRMPLPALASSNSPPNANPAAKNWVDRAWRLGVGAMLVSVGVIWLYLRRRQQARQRAALRRPTS